MSTPEEIVSGFMETCEHCQSPTCCEAKAPDHSPYVCTREPGHPGDHVACGAEHGMRRWPASSSG